MKSTSAALLVGAFAAVALAGGASAQSISLTSLSTPYSQDFDAPTSGLPTANATTASWNASTASTLNAFAGLPGWYWARTGSLNVVTGGDGSVGTGGLYSFGTTATNERALGSVSSGTTNNICYGAIFRNNTGGPVGSFQITARVEQWRVGSATTDLMPFSYAVSATLPTGFDDATLANPLAAGDIVPITQGGTGTAQDGNVNFTNLSFTVTLGSALPDGHYFTIKWRDADVTGTDQGMAIDNFTILPVAAPANFAPTLNTAVATPDQASPSTPLSFSVNAADSDGTVTGVNLFYKVAASGTATAGGYVSAPMTLTSGTPASGTWSVTPAALTSVPTGNNVFYYFQATDNVGDTGTLGDETTNAFRKYSNGQRPTGTDVVINEVSYKGGAPGPTPDVDWLEIHNRTASPIDLSYYGISDNGTLGTGGRPFVLPFGTVLPPGGFIVATGSTTSFNSFAPWVASLGSTPLFGDIPFGFGDVDDFRLYDDASTRVLLATLSYDRTVPPFDGANATGRSVEMINPASGTPYAGSNFSSSAYKNVTGTPGRPNWAVPSAPAAVPAGASVTVNQGATVSDTVIGTIDDNQTEAALLTVTDNAPVGMTTNYAILGGSVTVPATVDVDVTAAPALPATTYTVTATFTDAALSTATISYTVTVNAVSAVHDWTTLD